jgi:cytochrome c oxidase subunit 2
VRRGSVWTVLLLPVLAGCSGAQSALDPAGSGAGTIYGLWLLFLATTGIVFLAVMAVLLWSLLRGGRRTDSRPRDPPPAAERRIARLVTGATAATIVILLGLTIASYSADRALFMTGDPAPRVVLNGHRWWWEVRYAAGARFVTSANEIHIPVGESIPLTLESDDVIHSFWVPNLRGKMDLIPGQVNRLLLGADRAGSWRGQCAEFCGLQHAKMALSVVAEPRVDFERWLAREAADAAAPQSAAEASGREIMVAQCGMCHAVRGTAAVGTLAPDLTHIASRLTLAAGTLPNSRGNRAAWIVDPATIKPGTLMPATPLEPLALQQLLAYLDRLE